MIPPLDPFSRQFDSIELDPARAHSDALEHALAIAAPQPAFEEPGFYLIDNAQGRFVVDRQWGIVSLAHDDILAREAGAVYGVRLRVIEPSGASYELAMQLRLTGRVPQMVGAEEFAALAALTETLLPDLEAASVKPTPTPQAPIAIVAWSGFAAALATLGKAPAPQPQAPASFAFGDIAPAMPANAAWSL